MKRPELFQGRALRKKKTDGDQKKRKPAEGVKQIRRLPAGPATARGPQVIKKGAFSTKVSRGPASQAKATKAKHP